MSEFSHNDPQIRRVWDAWHMRKIVQFNRTRLPCLYLAHSFGLRPSVLLYRYFCFFFFVNFSSGLVLQMAFRPIKSWQQCQEGSLYRTQLVSLIPGSPFGYSFHDAMLYKAEIISDNGISNPITNHLGQVHITHFAHRNVVETHSSLVVSTLLTVTVFIWRAQCSVFI